MAKKKFTTTITGVALPHWDQQAQRLSLTRNQLIEAIVTGYFLKHLQLSKTEVDAFWNGLPRKGTSNLTTEFRNKHKGLPLPISITALEFFYQVALIPAVSFSTQNNANFFKGADFMFYYAFGDFRGSSIDNYLNTVNVTPITLGPTSSTNREYFYIAREQGFKHKTRKSNLFDRLCSLLSIPTCDCIRLHYSQMKRFADAIEQL